MGLVVALVLPACRGPAVTSIEAPPVEAGPASAEAGPAPSELPVTPVDFDFGSLFTRDEGDSVLAALGDLDIHKRHVFDRLQEVDPQRIRETIELLLLDARVRQRSEELGVEVPETDLRLAVRREWARVERAFRRRAGGARDVDDYVRRNYAMEPAAFRGRIRLLAWRRLMRAYTLRYLARRRGGVLLAYFQHARRPLAEQCRTQIAQGADFHVLARERSLDVSAVNGGRLPLLPLDFDHPAVRSAGDLEAGALSPVRPVGPSRSPTGWGFVRVLERRSPDRRPFRLQLPEIRRELERRPVDSSELALFLTGR